MFVQGWRYERIKKHWKMNVLSCCSDANFSHDWQTRRIHGSVCLPQPARKDILTNRVTVDASNQRQTAHRWSRGESLAWASELIGVMSKHDIVLKSTLSKTYPSAVNLTPRCLPASGSDTNTRWTSAGTVLGTLTLCYLSPLYSLAFLWPCQGAVIKGVCLCLYKTASLSYWISNDTPLDEYQLAFISTITHKRVLRFCCYLFTYDPYHTYNLAV